MALVDEVRRLLGESSAVFWTDPQIRDAINEAQVCVYSEHPRVFETNTTLTVPPEYDFVQIPAGVMLPRYITSTSGDTYYNFVTHADLEEYAKGWMDTSTGDPKAFVVWSSEWFRIWPRPDEQKTYTLFGTPWPVECTTATDPTFPWLVEDAVVSYATAMLFLPTRLDLAELHMQEYSDAMRDYMVQWRRAHPHNTARLSPGQGPIGGLFSAKQRGDIRVIRGCWPLRSSGLYA